MILEFTKRQVVNFGSFLEDHELDLKNLGLGLHFVKGDNQEEPRLQSNGAGKSSFIANALCWCLYGKTADGRRTPDLEPRFGDQHMSVTEHLLIDGKKHTVSRSTHPNRLLIDEKEVGQDQVDQLIGLSFDTFTHTVLLGQGRPLFFDLKPEAKMKLLGDVLQLEKWDARSKIAAEAASTLELKQSELNGELNGMEAQLTHLDTLLGMAKTDWKEWRDKKEQEAETDKAALLKLKTRREQVETEKAGFTLAYDSAATEFKAARNETNKLTIEGEALVNDRIPWTTKVATHKEKARQLRAELEALGDAEECPTCGQSLKGTNLSKHKTELKKQLVKAEHNLADAEDKRNGLVTSWNKLQPRLTRSREAERTFQHKVDDTRNGLDRINPAIAELNAQITQLETGVKKQQKEANPYTDQVSELKRKIKALEADFKELEARLKRLSEQIERTRFWIKGFKEIRLYIIEEVLQELELTTNAALAEVGLVDWQVSYDVERETKSGTVQRGLNVMIRSPKDKNPVKWECWSGGEGQRLRLVGALTLSEVLLARAGVEPKMEVLDEPTRGLSDQGVIDLCEYLADRAQQLDRVVMYIDHMSVESSRFTSVLTVRKTVKGSELVL